MIFAIIAVLTGLLLPAVGAARESSRRSQCSSNLRQIGIALHAYHDLAGSLPPGRIMSYDPRYAGVNPPCTSSIVDQGFLVLILPQMEQVSLYNSINSMLSMTGMENRTSHPVVIGSYACPSDHGAGLPRLLPSSETYQLPNPGDERWPMTFTSYSGNFGSLPTAAFAQPATKCVINPHQIAQNNGLFHDRSPIRLADITDGTSQTLMVIEKAVGLYSVYSPDDAVEANRFGWWVNGNMGDTLLTAFRPPNIHRWLGGSVLRTSASSFHDLGVNALFADGSVKFVKDSINSWPIDYYTRLPSGIHYDPRGWYESIPPPGVWQKLATRAGGELIEDQAN